MKEWQWQYNGVAPWRDIVIWCHTNLLDVDGNMYWWRSQWETIYFRREEDYALFLLRWS